MSNLRRDIEDQISGLLDDPKFLHRLVTEHVISGEIADRRREIAQLQDMLNPREVKPMALKLDPRIPSSGFVTRRTVHGVEWTFRMNDDGTVTATAHGVESVSGPIGKVGRIVFGMATFNPYQAFNLGNPGEMWSDHSPRTGWSRDI